MEKTNLLVHCAGVRPSWRGRWLLSCRGAISGWRCHSAPSSPGRNQQERPAPRALPPGQVPSSTARSIRAAGSARSVFPCWPYVPKISLSGRRVPGSCLQRGLRLGQVSPGAVLWGLGLPAGLGVAQLAAVPPHPGGAGSGSGRLLMWSINRGGDRVGQRREAGPVKHCGQ